MKTNFSQFSIKPIPVKEFLKFSEVSLKATYDDLKIHVSAESNLKWILNTSVIGRVSQSSLSLKLVASPYRTLVVILLQQLVSNSNSTEKLYL